MKKLGFTILAALAALIICAAAFANDTAADLFDKTVKLLFENKNITLNVNAEFSLDGQWFKTAEVTLKQDGELSFRKLHLRSPKADGTERQNGYTIMMDQNVLVLMEEFTPEVYRSGFAAERTSLLRHTAETQQMITLGRALASQADVLLGKDAVTKTEDGDIRIELGENTPAIADAALNQAVLFAARRYFDVDSDNIAMNGIYSTIKNYDTVTHGILYCMRGVSIRKAEITLKTDKDGNPTHAEGSIGLYLDTAEEGRRQLDVTFTADVTDMGSTMVKPFSPEDYNVVPAADSYDVLGFGEESRPEFNAALEDEMGRQAMEILGNTGFSMMSTTTVSCNWEDYCYIVSLDGGEDGISKKFYFTEDGHFFHYEATPTEWMDGVETSDEYDTETGLDAETDGKAKSFFMEFLENIHYDRIGEVKDLQVQWTLEKNGSRYALYEDKADPNGEGVYFVIRISPEMRIEAYSCANNG